MWSLADVPILAARPGRWLRVMIELSDVSASAAAPAADGILASLAELNLAVPVLLHGEQESCWPLITHAGQRGLSTRIGLEDTTAGPGGQPVSGNAELVRLALEMWTAAAR